MYDEIIEFGLISYLLLCSVSCFIFPLLLFLLIILNIRRVNTLVRSDKNEMEK